MMMIITMIVVKIVTVTQTGVAKDGIVVSIPF
jgi:hypothetical protein